MPLLGLAFDDITDPIVEAIGEGAYQIGGGDYQYGQNRVEADIKNLFRLPVPSLANALELLEEYLLWIPLDALRQFRDLLPDVTDLDFSDVPTAVATIIGGLTDNPLIITLLGQLIDLITGGLGGGFPLLGDFFTNFRDFVGIDFADGGFDLNNARQLFVTNVIEPFLAALAYVDQELRDVLTGITDATPGDLDDWLVGLLTGDSPLDALNLFNIVPPSLLGQLDISHIGTSVTNLLTDPTFLDAGALGAVTGWLHSLTGGFTGGSMSTTANGTTKELLGNLIPVSLGQKLPITGKAKWTGLLGSGNPISLAVTGYNQAGTAVDQKNVASHSVTPGTTDWLTLAGTYEVDNPAVTGIRTRLVVGSGATAGNVSFSDMSVTKTGTLLQRLISGTDPGTLLSDDIENLFNGTITNALALLDKVGLTDFSDLVAGLGGSLGSSIPDAIARVNTFLHSGSPLNGSNITAGSIADQFIPGIGNLHDNIVTAVGNLGGSGFDLSKVFEVLTGQTNALVGHGSGLSDVAARMSNLESQFAALPVSAGGTGSGNADGGAIGVIDTDLFERTNGSSISPLWITAYSGGAGTWTISNGHDATWNESGLSTREFLCIRDNPAILRSQTDYQRVTMELSSKADRDREFFGLYDYCGANDIWLRVSDATTSLANISGIRIRWEGDGALSIYRFISGAGVQLAGVGTGGITPPGPGAQLIGEAGVLSDGAIRYFRAKIGSAVRLQVQESGTASGIGATNRRWGHGGRAQGASLLVGQTKPGGVHFWNGSDQTL